MLTPHDLDWQKEMIAAVTAISPQPVTEALSRIIDPRFGHRITIYRSSFLGRTVSSLSEIVLAPVCKAFGHDLVKEVTARYFSVSPPATICIVDALKGLPDFVDEWSLGESASEFADLVRASLAYWDLLHGPNPVADTKNGHLNRPTKLVPASGAHDLFRAWNIATERTMVDTKPQEGCGVLLIKCASDVIETVAVPHGLLPLAAHMIQGMSIYEAIDAMTESEIACCDETHLTHFVQSACKSSVN